MKKDKLKKKYDQAKERLDYVSKGGKGYASCSFMDIATREEDFESAEKAYALALGLSILRKQA